VINLVFVGSWKDARLRETASEMEKRIRGLWNLSVEVVPEDIRGLTAWMDKHKNKGLLVSLDPWATRWIQGPSRAGSRLRAGT